ncbi:MAG: hypothetical protein IJ662_00400 [Clostridia bacterium]|nr:hypothetical protein [Clostridia bacterium]
MISILLLILYALWITPVKAGATLRLGGGPIRGEIGIMIWGLTVQGRYGMTDGQFHLWIGHKLLPTRKDRRVPKLPLLRHFFRSGPLGIRPVTLQALEIQVDVGAQSAATAALLCGLLQAAGGVTPILRLQARPRPGQPSALRARCIAQGRLGILLSAYILAAKAQKEEHHPWIIPSAT